MWGLAQVDDVLYKVDGVNVSGKELDEVSLMTQRGRDRQARGRGRRGRGVCVRERDRERERASEGVYRGGVEGWCWWGEG